MRKTIIFAILTGMLAAGCGGGGGNDDVVLGAVYPERLVPYSANLSAKGLVTGANEAILSAPSDGILEENNWRFHIEPIGEIPSSGASFRIEFVNESGILLATALLPYPLPQGQENILISESANFDFSADSDGDGVANIDELSLGLSPLISDSDGDGTPDGTDAFPLDPKEWLDTDADGAGDNSDDDIDGDGLSNDEEAIIGTDPAKPDSDEDGFIDSADNCPVKANSGQEDTDGDGKGDACEDDSDGDGLSDADEARFGSDGLKADTDGDGLGDGLEAAMGTSPLKADSDGDGLGDKDDNCPLAANAGQSDGDRDGIGDACDEDRDGDGIVNSEDNCPDTANIGQENRDGDKDGDACDADIDNDGARNDNGLDNCPYTFNPGQLATDADGDRIPVECDLDDTDAGVGDDEHAIFANIAHGSDADSGTRGAPLATIAAAVLKAAAKGYPIYVAAGTYDVSSLVIPNGTRIYGGFKTSNKAAERFGERKAANDDEAFKTTLLRNDAPTTLVIAAEGVVVDGFHIANGASSFHATDPSATVLVNSGSVNFERNHVKGNEASFRNIGLQLTGGIAVITGNLIDGGGHDAPGSLSTGTSIEGGNATVTNNILVAGNGRFATVMIMSGSKPAVSNNTMDARSGNSFAGVSMGIEMEDSSPMLAYNLIVTGNAPDQYALDCLGSEPNADSLINNNLFARTPKETGATIVRDCNGKGYGSSEAIVMGEAFVRDNTLSQYASFSDLLDTAYVVVGGVDPLIGAAER